MKLIKVLSLMSIIGIFGCGNNNNNNNSTPTAGATEANRVASEQDTVESNVVITRNNFTPATVTINMGDTVKWTNASTRQESVTADPSVAADDGDVMLPQGAPAFNSGMLNPGQTFSYTFFTPGTYQYFTLGDANEGPKGKVLVKDASGNVPPVPSNTDNNGGNDDGTPDRGPGDN